MLRMYAFWSYIKKKGFSQCRREHTWPLFEWFGSFCLPSVSVSLILNILVKMKCSSFICHRMKFWATCKGLFIRGKNGPVFDNSESSCKLWTSLENSENNNLGRLFSTFEIFISTSCTWMYKINHCSFAYSDHLKFFGMQIITSASVSAINCTNAWQRALWSCHGLC